VSYVVESIDIPKISAAIVAQKAPWKAMEYDFLKKPELLMNKLGVIVDEPRLQVLRALPRPNIAQIVADFKTVPAFTPAPVAGATLTAGPTISPMRPMPFPWPLPPLLPKVDWRNSPEKENDVTPVKDQGGCGSCVSFGTTATLESMVLIDHNVSLDLSEAELLFCGGGSCGGWWPDSAITYLINHGESQETCFPYHDYNMPCQTCEDRNGEAIQITKSTVLWNMADRKAYLHNVGPMICVFAVYSDFFSYQTGTYKHVWGGLAGYHCVEVIGFDDNGGFWICKNSWGTGWGESGFFCIAYGECGIDSQFPFWGIGGTKWYGISP